MKITGLTLIILMVFSCWALPNKKSDLKIPSEGMDVKVRQVIKRMLTAERNLNLIGKRLSILGTERFEEKVYRLGNKSRTEYLSPAAHKGEIIIDHGKTAWHYQPKQNAWVQVPSPRGKQLLLLLSSLKEGNSEINLTRTDKVAGRKADILVIKTLPAKSIDKLWIDDPTGLTLKRELYSPDGKLIGKFEYVSVVFNPKELNESLFVADNALKPASFRDIEALKKEAPFTVHLIPESILPDGMTFVQGFIRDIKGKPAVAVHYRGNRKHLTLLQAVSLGNNFDRSEFPKAGVMNNFYFWNVGDRWYGLVGNLSLEKIKAIAKTVGAP